MSLDSGTRLGVYEISAPIGKGGMGEVYRARDTKLGRDVAIKILPPEFAADPDRLARFNREAKVLASLNHPNIASIYGFEEAEGCHYLVLELVPGETLAERIARGPIPFDEARGIAIQMAAALDDAHERGIIHPIWLLDSSRGTATLLPGDDTMGSPLWSPDGASILHMASVPAPALKIIPASGGRSERLLPDTTLLFPTDWSRDGAIAYMSGSFGSGSSQLWILPPDGGEPFVIVPSRNRHRWEILAGRSPLCLRVDGLGPARSLRHDTSIG